MPKNITIAKYDIDIENIQKKIQQVQDDLSGSEMESFIPKTLLKDMDDLQKKLEKFRKTSPVSTSTHKDIEKFLKEWERVSIELDDLDSKMNKISFSDAGIKENIKEISELVNKYKEAVKARKDYAEKITSESGVKNVTGGIYRAKLEAKRNKMAEAATKGGAGVEEIKSIAQDGRTELKERLTWINQNRTNTEIIKKETKEVGEQLKLWNAIEQSALRYAENQQRNIDNENELNIELEKQIQFYKGDLITGLERQKNGVHLVKEEVENTTIALKQMSAETLKQEERQSNIDTMTARIKDMFSAATVISTIRHIVRGAIQDFQELDKQFNEIAIVSDYTTKEMWQSFASVNKVAQEFGVETKNVLEVQNLYYHQGKDMAEVNKLTAQTLTLAKITGMDYERATSDLTAALNAYNIAAEDAVRVTDTIAAMDTNAAISSEELMTALTKTASIAANAGMSLESTEVFLTKMIETTREAPENLGTALKTIIARFGEVKQEIDGEEIELADINRVDTALKSIGISLLDTAGQIRDLDGVFMELSSKWDDLDRNTQRYIATIAAGSRQQSRFIAMMEDYDRTLELTEIAQNSAGLGARQLAKSQESIETSVNRLKSTWQEFYSSLITSGMIKGVLELANSILSLINKLNDVSPLLGTVVAALSIWGIKTQIADKMVLKLGQSIGTGIGQTAGFSSVTNLMIAALDKTQKEALLASNAVNEYTKSLIKASLAEENVGNSVLINTNMGGKKAKKLKKKYGLGFIDEKGQKTQKYKDFNLLNKQRISKGKKPISMENFDFFNEKNRVKNLFLEKTKGVKLTGKGSIESLKNLKLTDGLKSFSSVSKSGFSSVLTKVGGLFGKLAGAISGVVQFLGGPLTAAILTAIGAFVIWKKFFAASLDDTKKVEKLQKSQEEYNKTLKEYNDLKEKAKIIEKYSDRKNLSAEQLQEQQEAAKALVNEYPELLNYIDEEGNYYLKDAEAIQAVIDKKQELLDQEATNYTELRLKYAQEGIYADETTSAGKTMKNIQSYAASLDEDQLKEAVKEIDAAWQGISFNGSQYKKMMQAFAEGKKYSFDEKDMSSLFAGDIGEKNWNKFLKAVNENPIVLESEETLAKALQETDAYSENNAKEVAQAFIKMNNENGKLFSRLIEGAAQEYSQIEIQQAKIEIAKGDFATDLSSEVTDTLARAALENVKALHPNWDDLDEDIRTSYIEEETEKLVSAFEALTKQQIEGINAVFTSGNAGALKISDIRNFNTDANTEAEQEAALQAFWDVLPEEIQKQFPRERIPTLSAQVVEVLFNLIKETIGDAGVKELVEGLIKNFNDSKDMYTTGDFKFDSNLLEGLTLDQIKALTNKTNSMSTEQISPYLSTVMAEYKKALDTLDVEQATEVINVLAKADLATQDGIENTAKNLQSLGYAVKEVWDIAIAAANGIDNISLDNFTSATERAKKEVEQLATNLEGATALIEGSASLDQLERYMSQMMDYWTETQGIEQATVLMQQLNDSVVATGDGFKIGAAAGGNYAKSLVEMTKSMIVCRIAALELEMETRELSDQEKANYLMTIAYLKQTYAYVDAQSKKAINDGLVKDLEKAKEKADELVESLKELVDWLMKFDRFSNLDNISEGLENDFGHLEYEIEFSTNTDVIKRDIEDQVKNINTQIAVNQGGLRAAEDEKVMRRDVIEKNYSDYVSFDANGKAIVSAQKMQKLQEQIAKADEARKPALQAEADLIKDSVDAYNSAENAVEKYSSALEDNFSDLEKVLNDIYEAEIEMTDKLIEVRMEQEDKELEAVKDKYDAIKEENDKYLDSIKKMVDEERRIRDRANREQDVKDKEKKLAMMKMDTSGVYTSDIRAMEKELEGDYRDLEDEAVDDAIRQLEERNSTQAEALDREVEYMENTLEYKREIMTEYNDWANNLIKSGSDEVIAYLKANNEEYATATVAKQKQIELEWTSSAARAEAAHKLMAEGLIEDVSTSFEICKKSAGGFDEAVTKYSQNAIASNGEIEDSVERLAEYYENLAQGVSDVTTNINSLQSAYINAANAAKDLKTAQDAVIYGSGPTQEEFNNVKNELNSNNKNGEKGVLKKSSDKVDSPFIATTKEAYDNPLVANDRTEVVRVYSQLGTKMGVVYVPKDAFNIFGAYKNKSGGWSYPIDDTIGTYYYKFAKGGYVDYTGPAWVDGTKSHPEYMLNATQTQQFETLVAALSSMFSHGAAPLISQSSQKLGDATYNFHINVDQMASDYDVDQLISRIEEKMVKASQYRNVTLVKKQK